MIFTKDECYYYATDEIPAYFYVCEVWKSLNRCDFHWFVLAFVIFSLCIVDYFAAFLLMEKQNKNIFHAQERDKKNVLMKKVE